MRGATVFSYALVAFATTVYAAPLIVRDGDLLEARDAYNLPGRFVSKVGVVTPGQGFV
jgi:hypothetical protein